MLGQSKGNTIEVSLRSLRDKRLTDKACGSNRRGRGLERGHEQNAAKRSRVVVRIDNAMGIDIVNVVDSWASLRRLHGRQPRWCVPIHLRLCKAGGKAWRV